MYQYSGEDLGVNDYLPLPYIIPLSTACESTDMHRFGIFDTGKKANDMSMIMPHVAQSHKMII